MTARNTKKRTTTLTPLTMIQISRIMLPFYRKIAVNGRFARKWSLAVRKADLDKLQKLWIQAAGKHDAGLSTNAIGYFIDFACPAPVYGFTNGTTIPPGSVQFTFSTHVHRSLARAVYPFYRRLSNNPSFATAAANAIRLRRGREFRRLVRSCISTKKLQRISLEASGFRLGFRFPFSQYRYDNLLARIDVP